MKINTYKKYFTIFIIFLLISSSFPPLSASANIEVVEDGMPISSTNKYEIREFSNLDYFLREYWDVRVDNVVKGKMALFAPPGEKSNQGRTMVHKDTLFQWGQAFNGNPQYVQDNMLSNPTLIKRLNDNKNFNRYYSVEIGRHSGARVVAKGSGSNGYLEVTTSPFPLITKLQTSSEVTQNTDFDVVFSGIEYDPFSSNMSYKVLVNGSPKATGTLSAAELGVAGNPAANGTVNNKVEKIQITRTGTYTVELLLTDGIQRTSSRKATVNVKAKPPTGNPSLEITPSVQMVKIGEIGTYKAIYHDGKGGQLDVSTLASTTWSVANTTIGQLQSTKGKVKGLKIGDTDVTVKYSNLTATGTLIVAADPPPPTPPEPENLPPTVRIIGPNEVMVGEHFCLTANASDPDGTVEEYAWAYTGSGVLSGKSSCYLSYGTEGIQNVSVTVYDDKGASASANHMIKVIPPIPVAHFTVSGTEKENRKLSINPIHPYGNRTGVIARSPIVKDRIKITAKESTKQAGVKVIQDLTKNIDFSKTVDFLVKQEGTYTIERYVENTHGYSDTYTFDLIVHKDLLPVADFSAITLLYRDEVKETDADTSKATIKVDDFSYSSDDSIVKRIWSVTYDSNNNGSFDDETPQILSEANLDSISFKTDKVGKYKIELEVYEQFEQPTIDQFVDLSFDKSKTDRRFHNTISKMEKVIEVDNLAPIVSFEMKESKKVEIEIQRGQIDVTELEAAVNNKLKTKLFAENIEANIVYNDVILNREDDPYALSLPKTGIEVGKQYNYDHRFSPSAAKQLSNGNYVIAGGQSYGVNTLESRPSITLLDSEFNQLASEEVDALFYYNASDIVEMADGKIMVVPRMWYGDEQVHIWESDLSEYTAINVYKVNWTSNPNIKQIVPIDNNKFIFLSDESIGVYQFKNNDFVKLWSSKYPTIQYDEYTLDNQSFMKIVGDRLIIDKYWHNPYSGDTVSRWGNFKFTLQPDNSINFQLESSGSIGDSYSRVLSNSGEYIALYRSYPSDHVAIYRLSDMSFVKSITNSGSYRVLEDKIVPVGEDEFFIGRDYWNDYAGTTTFEYVIFNPKTGETEVRRLPLGDYRKYITSGKLVPLNNTNTFLTTSNLTKNKTNANFAVLQLGLYNEINIDQSIDDHFTLLFDNSTITNDGGDLLKTRLGNVDSHLLAYSKAENEPILKDVISSNNGKGIYYDSSDNLSSSLEQMADYIIEQVRMNKDYKTYITLEESIQYKTFYADFEKDPKMADRWKYEHIPSEFENDMGLDSRHMKDLDTPIEQFSKVGSYQPYYSAKDDPISDIFTTDKIPLFDKYRKWAKDADNWTIYVHRKPVPEFSFTTNNFTRAYTLTNEAYDLDKYSINIGHGPGLKHQKFFWRIQGETTWKEGLPNSPLDLKVYEIRNTVTDFQNKTESMVKKLNATGLNVPPIPLFEIENYIPQGTNVVPRDLSYDPNGDAITGYLWQIKKKSEPDSAFKDIANSANKAAPEIPFNTVGTYVIRLKVKDQPGLWSAPPNEWHYEEVEVYSPNSPPVAGFNITPQQYIGEAIDITSTATDLDGDTLIYEYTVKPPGSRAAFVFKTGESVTDRNGKVISVASNGNLQIPTYDQTDVGIWTVTQKVTDPMGASATAGPKQAVVKDLTMKGYVNHTEAWQQIHLDKGNLPHEFYSGEKFILKADVISRPIRSVSVKATGRLENNSNFNASVTLNKDTDILYAGEYFEQRFTEIGSQIRTGTDVTFVFTTIYENGTLEGYAVTDIVTVTIIGSALGLLELHQAY